LFLRTQKKQFYNAKIIKHPRIGKFLNGFFNGFFPKKLLQILHVFAGHLRLCRRSPTHLEGRGENKALALGPGAGG
jgi:hypothetical protein